MSALPAGYRLTQDPSEIDGVAAHSYLARSYWAKNIPLATVEAAIRNPFCLGAQPLYRKAGWTKYPHSDRVMVRENPDIYA